MDMALLDPQRALAHKMAPVARNWRRLADEALAELGVSNSAAWCLLHIERDGPTVRQTDLADSLDVAGPSLVRTLAQLESAGLVERAQHPNDKRSNLIGLTEKGHELAGRAEARLADLRADLLKDVPDDVVEVAVWLFDLLNLRIREYRTRP